MHGDASESQNCKQKQFRRVLHQAVEDIDIDRAPRDQRTRVLGKSEKLHKAPSRRCADRIKTQASSGVGRSLQGSAKDSQLQRLTRH
jgi:hypothetical protein